MTYSDSAYTTMDWLYTQLHDAKLQLQQARANYEQSRNTGNKRLLDIACNQAVIIWQLLRLVSIHAGDIEEVEFCDLPATITTLLKPSQFELDHEAIIREVREEQEARDDRDQ